MSDHLTPCDIKKCKRPAESLKLYGLELCMEHQFGIAAWNLEQLEHPEMFKCPSYYNDDNVLVGCTCGRCEQ